MPLRILLSHTHTERALAEMWKKLLARISFGTIEPWYSSDTQPDGGMAIGDEWREQLRGRIAESDFVLAILSPQSRDRPWILWECGVANGIASQANTTRKGIVIPVLHSMQSNELTNPLTSFQLYRADRREDVIEICSRLAVKAGLPHPEPDLWGSLIDDFMSALAAHRPRRARRPEEMAMWRGRIEEHMQRGRLSEIPALREAMYAGFGRPFEPQDPMLHDLLSRAMLDCKMYSEVIQEVDHALHLVDFDVHLLHRRALAAVSLHDLGTAMETITKLKAVDPTLATNPEIAGLEGRIFRERFDVSRDSGDLRDARAAYTRGMEGNQMDYYCAVNAGSLALVAGDQSAADRAFAHALTAANMVRERPPTSYWADFTVGEILLGQGDIEAATAAYKRGLERVPRPSPRDRQSALLGAKRMAQLRKYDAVVTQQLQNLLEPSPELTSEVLR